jgi:hypothetical protein
MWCGVGYWVHAVTETCECEHARRGRLVARSVGRVGGRVRPWGRVSLRAHASRSALVAAVCCAPDADRRVWQCLLLMRVRARRRDCRAVRAWRSTDQRVARAVLCVALSCAAPAGGGWVRACAKPRTRAQPCVPQQAACIVLPPCECMRVLAPARTAHACGVSCVFFGLLACLCSVLGAVTRGPARAAAGCVGAVLCAAGAAAAACSSATAAAARRPQQRCRQARVGRGMAQRWWSGGCVEGNGVCAFVCVAVGCNSGVAVVGRHAAVVTTNSKHAQYATCRALAARQASSRTRTQIGQDSGHRPGHTHAHTRTHAREHTRTHRGHARGVEQPACAGTRGTLLRYAARALCAPAATHSGRHQILGGCMLSRTDACSAGRMRAQQRGTPGPQHARPRGQVTDPDGLQRGAATTRRNKGVSAARGGARGGAHCPL